MIKVTMILDYETLDKFRESFLWEMFTKIMRTRKCISWTSKEVDEA